MQSNAQQTAATSVIVPISQLPIAETEEFGVSCDIDVAAMEDDVSEEGAAVKRPKAMAPKGDDFSYIY
jgi:hypothetical protein